MSHESWGRCPPARHQSVHFQHWPSQNLPKAERTLLPYGLGRSYGDACLNNGGSLLDTRYLNRFIHFDRQSGLLRCEAGVSLAEILQLVVPVGWFLPVTPGTRFVTVGGAIANDVHGKNHHKVGTFGRHVRCFELLRSDGQRLLCSPSQNREWFAATISGLGLTGLIVWAEIQLIPIHNPLILEESVKFRHVDEFFEISAESAGQYDYTVAWLDCMAQGRQLGRGLFMRGNHAPPQWPPKYCMKPGGKLRVPMDMPDFMLNTLSVKAFNQLYYHKQLRKRVVKTSHYEPFFYPLDSVAEWNRIYGKRGFFQHQCVVPYEDHSVIKEILRAIAVSGLGSFLGVLKVFGDVKSPGLMSFPRKGVTLALDFPNQGEKTRALFDTLDQLVRDSGGALYPAKDACMSPEDFQRAYPRWQTFCEYIDPQFSSSFWRRVSESA